MTKLQKKFIKQLRLAHAIEVGAEYAYEGHLRTAKTYSIYKAIEKIQNEEIQHQNDIKAMLERYDGEPSMIRDFVMKIIGFLVTIACFISPRFATNFGARVMEILGAKSYLIIARTAHQIGDMKAWTQLKKMQAVEERHEKFFKEL